MRHYIGTGTNGGDADRGRPAEDHTAWPDPVVRRVRLNPEVTQLPDVLDRHDHEHADIDQVWLIGSMVDADADVRSTNDKLVALGGRHHRR